MLNSPGVEVTIIDQSQYLSAAPSSVPLVVVATAENKANAAGTGIAAATTATNANKLYRVTSQRDLVTLYGNPFFYKTTTGTPLQGYELNEYGLLAAYSVLGSTNLCYVLRADIDLASLVGRTGRPSGPPEDATYWVDLTSSTWGIFEFNGSTGLFSAITPLVINDTDLLDIGGSGAPRDFVGNIGDYAVTFNVDVNNFTVANQPNTYNTYWYKATDNTWVSVGSHDWRSNWATIQGSVTEPTLVAGQQITLNGVTVTVPVGPNNTISGLVGAINSANIPFLTAQKVNGKIEMYFADQGMITINDVGLGTTCSLLGITEGNHYAPALFYGTNAQQPQWRSTDSQPHPSGSVWIKTNSANRGTSIAISQYSASTATFTSKSCPLALNDWSITNSLDYYGGKNITAGTLYAQYGFDGEELSAPLQLYRRAQSGAAIFVGSNTTPLFATTTLSVYVSVPGSANLDGPYNISLTSGDDATDFVTAWSAAAIPFTTATVASTGVIVLTHTEGGVIVLDDNDDINSASEEAGFIIGTAPEDCTPGAKWGPYKTVTETNVAASGGGGTGATFDIESVGFVPSFTVNNGGTGGTYAVGNVLTVNQYQVKVTAVSGSDVSAVEWLSGTAIPAYTVLLSNWYPLSYVPNLISPTTYPDNGTNWYYSVTNQIDIMTNMGGQWYGYKNVAYASNGLPQSSGVNTTDPLGPILSASAPTTQTDGTSLVYGDLWVDTNDLENFPVISRWENVDGVDQWVLIDNTDQLTENGIVFADARWGVSGVIDPVYDPLPSIVDLLTSDYLDLDAPPATDYPQGTLLFNTRRSGYNVKQFRVNYFNAADFPDQVLPAETSAWVTASGNRTDGSPYMGRKAQRSMVVQAMSTAVNTNQQIREEDTFFNLIAAPNYPELQPEMITLNNDRNETAYIIGDTPMRLKDDANDIVAWATNAAGVTRTGESGLVTRNSYMGLYYPSGITTDLTGTEVVVPASHMILRTMVYNDTVAYPWFAPAGQLRGVVDNATNIGYIDAASGEFVATKNRVALRDVEYTSFINPVAYFTNLGILNFGNKNSYDSQSALDRTNVARLICYIRWNLQRALRPFIFEQNDGITRAQVKSVVQTLMADIQVKRGLYDYLVVCDESNNTPARIDRNELWVDVAIEPTKTAEFIYVPVRILNTGEIAGLTQNG